MEMLGKSKEMRENIFKKKKIVIIMCMHIREEIECDIKAAM